jgi:hypothetical protein
MASQHREEGGINVYLLADNRVISRFDYLGLSIKDSIEYINELPYADFVERYKNTKLKFPAPGVVGCAEVFIYGSVKFERCPPPKQNCSKTVIRKDTEMQGQIFWIGDRADSCDIAVHEYIHINNGHKQAGIFDKFLHAVADGKIVKNRCAYSKVRLVEKAEKYIQSKLDLIDMQFDYDEYGKD